MYLTELLRNLKILKQRLGDHSCASSIWLINFLPKIAGFSLNNEKVNVLFWIIHINLLFYVYLVGTVVYLMYHTESYIDSVNSIFNIPIMLLVLSVSMWFICKRETIKTILKLSQQNADLLIDTNRFLDIYNKMLRNIKIIIFVSYLFHIVNDIMIFIPSRIFDMDSFSVTSCAGMDLTTSPSRDICRIVLTSQEATSIVAVGGYDAITLFLFSHTTAIFHVLYKDMDSFSQITHNINHSTLDLINYRLKNLIQRHALVLRTVAMMQELFTIAIGVGFVLNAVSLCLFFVLPLEVCLSYGPLIYYYLSVFLLYCYQGQRLTNASEKFEMAVYCCGWENFGLKERRMVLIMLRQAQKPVSLRAAKIIPLCMYTFAGTMQNIYKFVTIFKV